MPDKHYLAIDIGGTKTATALFATADTSFSPLVSARYPSKDHGGIETIISDFLGRSGLRPATVCLGVAGVVGPTEARVTNLPWTVRADDLKRLGFSNVAMVNDMTALSASLPLLGAQDFFTVQPGNGPAGEVAAVLAPGTGLGEGFLLQREADCFPRGSEGGHCDFAPIGEEQQALRDWLATRGGGVVSYEMVCAGPALSVIYDFLCAQGELPAAAVQDQMLDVADRTPVVVDAALSGECQVCRRAVELFLSILGREGANLVMKVYARKGLYLGGSILPRLAGNFTFTPFLSAFRQTGAMAELLRATPVFVIQRNDSVLLGTAWFARRLAEMARS